MTRLAIMKILGIAVIAILVLFCGVLAYLRLNAVPLEPPLESGTRISTNPVQSIPADGQIMRMVVRAKLDYLVAPIPGHRQRLSFTQVLFREPDELFLDFDTSDQNTVEYRASRAQGRLISKDYFTKVSCCP